MYTHYLVGPSGYVQFTGTLAACLQHLAACGTRYGWRIVAIADYRKVSA